MQKYIHDTLRNNLRSIISSLTRPQQKAVEEIMRGLFTAGKPILRALAQYDDITKKKQAEKYSYHLGNVNLTVAVDDLAMKRARSFLRKDTIIAYDCTDVAKEYAHKMENISGIFDGSRRKPSRGFLLHGVGMNNILLKLLVHDANEHTTNQTRYSILRSLSKNLNGKGIWVFDRGHDDAQFFADLRQIHNVRFIARLRENRHVIIAKTGEKMAVRDIRPGVYPVFLPHRIWRRGIDWSIGLMTLVIDEHLEEKEPIRLLTNLHWQDYGSKRIVSMYLDRWGIENIFRRAKTKFDLEKIRVLKYQKFVNLVSLIQLAVIVSTITFIAIQKSTEMLIIGVLSLYERFLRYRSLTFNVDSFISFMQTSLKPLQKRHERSPPTQLHLFSAPTLLKLA